MQYMQCGDMQVSAIGLGTRTFGSSIKSTAEWEKTLAYALECGINLIDTAPLYQSGQSEKLLGCLLKQKRQQVCLSTKAGTHGTASSLTTDSIRESVIGSLERLQTDYLDILFIHYPDPRADYTEIAVLLESLLQEGIIRSFGLSNFDRRELNRWPRSAPPLFLQLPYSLLQQDQYTEAHAYLENDNIFPMVYTPLAAGSLALSPDALNTAGDYQKMFYSLLLPEGKSTLDELHRLALKNNINIATMAIAWSLNRDKNITLVGLGSKKHIDLALKSLEIYTADYIQNLPTIAQPVMPLKATITKILKTGSNEILAMVKVGRLNIEIPLWVDSPAQIDDALEVDGLSGKLIR